MQKCAGRPLLFYSLTFEIVHRLVGNTVQYGVLTLNMPTPLISKYHRMPFGKGR